MALLEVNHITKSYGNNIVLDDVTFSIPKGKIVGLLGPNGSGKTTLIKLINDLLKEDSGTIKVEGLDLGVETKKLISYLPDKNYLNNNMTVLELLNYFKDFYLDFRIDKAKELISKLGLDLSDVTDIVLSHSHIDHTGGFARLQDLYKKMLKAGISLNTKNVIAHSDLFEPKLDRNSRNVGFPLTEKDICDIFELDLIREPKYLTPKLLYLGEIFPTYNYDPKYKDETALAYKTPNGLVIIAGCSHVGVVNIIEHAKRITGEKHIFAFIGGMYLMEKTEYKIR